jgi:hypothetical protein
MSSLHDSTDTIWFPFLSRLSLVGGLALLILLVLGIAVVLPAGQGSTLPAEYGELMAAANNPTLYRLFAALDMIVWLSLGGLFLALAAIFARKAPIRSTFIRACGIGQVMGAFGAMVRLAAVTELAADYASAPPNQQAALLLPYLNLQWILDCAFRMGSLLWGAAFILAATVAWASPGFPRWLAVLLAAPGILDLSALIGFIFTGHELEFLLFPELLLLVVNFLSLAALFWRRSR